MEVYMNEQNNQTNSNVNNQFGAMPDQPSQMNANTSNQYGTMSGQSNQVNSNMNNQFGVMPDQSGHMNANASNQYETMLEQNNPANTNINNNVKNKKKNLLPIIIIAIVIIVGIVGAMSLFNGKNGSSTINKSKYEKTLTCKVASSVGITTKYVYYINDGSVAMSNILIYDLNKIEFSGGTAEDWAKEQVDESKKECTNTGCSVNYNLVKDKTLEITIDFSEKASINTLGQGVKNKTAEEIYDTLKTAMENQWYVCEN